MTTFSGRVITVLVLLLCRCSESNLFTQGSITAKSCHGNRCEVDVSNLGPVATTNLLEVQLHPNAPIRYFEVHPSSTRSANLNDPEWYGEDVGSIAAINLLQENNRLYGSVVVEGAVYQIITTADNKTEAIMTAAADFPPEGEALPLPDGTTIDIERRLVQHSSKSNLRGTSHAVHRVLWDDYGGNLDIMVVWTKYAECMVAGNVERECNLDQNTKDAMVGMVMLAVEETNKAYELSGVATQLRLVHAYRHDEYKESSTNAFSDALDHITDPNDGFMDDVNEKRELYGADLVAMIIDDASVCGLAWEGPNKDYMFSITSWRCSTGHFSFGHELSHNMGCGHDTGTTNSCAHGNPTNDYSYGYRDPQGAFRSIMAYGCKIGECDNVQQTIPCTRLQRFSNPNFLIDGRPIGHGAADNARKINEVKHVIAAYYPVAETCDSDAECQAIDPCMQCGDGWPGINVCVPGQDCSTGLENSESTSSSTPTSTETPSQTFNPTFSASPSSYPSSYPTPSISNVPTLAPTTSAQPSSTMTPSDDSVQPSPVPRYGCSNDPDWIYEDLHGDLHGCTWVSDEPDLHCRKIGLDSRPALTACQEACDNCPT